MGSAVDGSLVYVADGYLGDGLVILDVSDPAAPVRIGNYPAVSYASDVAVAWPYAYVADYHGDVLILDVTDPTQPSELSTIESQLPWSLLHRDGVLYVASLGTGVSIYDVTDPSSSVLLADYPLEDGAAGIDLVGSTLFVAAAEAGLLVLDVTDPTSPEAIGQLAVGQQLVGLAASPSLVLAVDMLSSRAYVIDVENPSAPWLQSSIASPFPFSVVQSGSYGLVSATGGIQVVDLSEPDSPVDLGRFPLPSTTYAVSISAGLAFVGDSSGGFHVLETGVLSPVVALGRADTPGVSRDVGVTGDYILVAEDWAGVTVVDVSDPNVPTVVVSIDTPGRSVGLDLEGEFLFVADSGQGLTIADLTVPTSPILLGGLDTPGEGRDVDVVGTVAYLADGPGGVAIIDVSDVMQPVAIDVLSTSGEATALRAVSGYLYVAAGSGGVQVFDIAAPDDVTLLGTAATPAPAVGIAVEGSTAVVAMGTTGLGIIDVSDPVHPALVATFDTPGNARGIDLDGSVVYVADWNCGVQIVDVSDPARPVSLGVFLGAQTTGVKAHGGYVVVADGGDGVAVIPSHCAPTSSAVLPTPVDGELWIAARENPSIGDVGVRWYAPRASAARLTVHDVAGRRLATIFQGTVRSGWHDIVWDGRSAAGSFASAGRYFLRVETEEGVASAPVTRIR